MKFKHIISVVLAMIIAFSACVPVYSAGEDSTEIKSISEYKEMLWEEGYPAITTADFLAVCNTLLSMGNFLTGKGFTPGNTFKVEFDDFVAGKCNDVYEACGLDVVALMGNIPNPGIDKLLTNTFKVDTVALKNAIFELRDKYRAEGNETMVKLLFMLGSYVSVIENCVVMGVPTEDDPVVYEVVLELTYQDGTSDTMHPGIFINSETGRCTNKDGTGLVGTGFEVNLSDMVVYATINAWMRDFGFCLLYDIAANAMPPLWNYVTRRFKFDYDGLEWMIQIWKGNYVITNGGEVGVYNREPIRFGSYYDCATDDQLMEMTLQIYHGDDLLVDQKPQMHWWINGFNMSGRMYLPESLTMKFSIKMPEKEMVEAFCKSIDRHYKHDVTYTVKDLTVYVTW